jgi:hypothetical protein
MFETFEHLNFGFVSKPGTRLKGGESEGQFRYSDFGFIVLTETPGRQSLLGSHPAKRDGLT